MVNKISQGTEVESHDLEVVMAPSDQKDSDKGRCLWQILVS